MPPARRRLLVGLGMSVLSGICFFLAFPPLNLWPLVFIAIALYLIPQHRLLPVAWAALAPTIAMAVWLWPFLFRIFNIEGAPLWLLHLGFLVAVLTFFTSTERRFHEMTGYRWFVPQGLAAWVGFEMIRSFIPFLGTMGFIANPLAGQPWLIQPISIFSIYGLNLLVVLTNMVIAQWVIGRMDRHWHVAESVEVLPRRIRRWSVAAAILLAGWVGLSLLILLQHPEDRESVRVAALHMDLEEPGHQVDNTVQIRRLELLAEQAAEAAHQGAVIAFVPEMTFGFDPENQYTDEVVDMAVRNRLYLYIAFAYHDDDGWHNETLLIGPDGSFSPVYGKMKPFGEPPTVSRGSFPVSSTPFGDLGSIICMDGVFTKPARNTVAKGAGILGIPSFNTTIGISEQNWTHFVMRSVENQVPVVNADRGYYSFISDSRGRILSDIRTPGGGSGVIVADVMARERKSLYTRLRWDWPGYLALAAYLFFLVFPGVIRRRIAEHDAEPSME